MVNFSLLFKYNLFFTTILFLSFLSYNSDYTVVSFFLLSLGAISSSIILYILLYILLVAFSFTKKFILYLSATIFLVINLSLIIDFLIFRVYKFHINAMVINIITSPDALDSMQIGTGPIIAFFVITLSLITFEIFLIKKILKSTLLNKKIKNQKLNKSIVIPFILIVFTEKISYGLLSLFNKNDIVTQFKVIPLYQPLTFNRVAAKYFDYMPKKEASNTIKVNAKLNYPLKDIVVKDKPNTFNIFIIASDAVRNSAINDEITPNVQKFKKDSITFNNNYSGGNATRFGIFSFMYGLNSTYWFNFLNANKGPVLFDVLKKLDYDINIISSTNTNWPEFRKTTYLDVQNSISDKFEGKPWEKDKQSSQLSIDVIDKYETKKPKFQFLFFDAPHGYSFPPSFNKFKAEGQNINYLRATKGSKEVESAFAGYKNAIHYNDKLFGDIIKKLKEKNLYDNSLIVFTSDHGQEFYESGFFGHNSAFSKEQTNSPLIIKLPKSIENTLGSKKIEFMTSHLDFVPTVLSLIGVKNDTKEYSHGYNIFSKDYDRKYSFVANWNNNAIITNELTYIFSNLPNKMFNNEIRDSKKYKKVKDSKNNTKLILEVINQNRIFIK